jgi:hypothetical protein
VTNATTVPGGLEARQPVPPPARTPAEIEAEIEATRNRLAGTVDAIADRVKPANVARRGAESAIGRFVDDDGNLRPDRVAVLAAALGVAVGLVLWRRSR